MKPAFRPPEYAPRAALTLLISVCTAAGADRAAVSPPPAAATDEAFFQAEPNPGEALDPQGYWPRGRRFVFMGYSGKPAENLRQGFSVAGPVYGDQMPYLLQCETNGWPVVAHVGVKLDFVKGGEAARYDEDALHRDIAAQMARLAPLKSIIWWAITPEELRPWRANEMRYLELVSGWIRELDPQKRPLYLYNPNNRDAGALKTIARWVDIVAKGSYVNSTGHKNSRGWVRWSVEQEVEAARAVGGRVVLLNPALSQDPEPGEESMIRAWVRHDVYLGLCSGARGVLIWSLFPRAAVKRTYSQWLDAYAECGRELTGPRALGEVFLYGRPRSDLRVERREADGTRSAVPDTLTTAEFSLAGDRYLFVINSTPAPAAAAVSGMPARARVTDAFTDEVRPLPADGPLPLELPPWGVIALRLQKP